MFTAPIQSGKWNDLCTGIESISLGQKVYEDQLLLAGFRLLSKFTGEGANNYYDTELL